MVIMMREFLEKALQQNVTIKEGRELFEKLPLAYRGRYDFFLLKPMECYGQQYIQKTRLDLLCFEKIEQELKRRSD